MWTLRSSSSTALSRSSWVVSGITNWKKKKQRWCRYQFLKYFIQYQYQEMCRPLKASYLIVGVVKVHRLTKSHFSFRLQVVQLDRSRELQDPTEKKRGQRSGGHSYRSAMTTLKWWTWSKAHLFSPLNSNFTLTSFCWKDSHVKFMSDEWTWTHENTDILLFSKKHPCQFRIKSPLFTGRPLLSHTVCRKCCVWLTAA